MTLRDDVPKLPEAIRRWQRLPVHDRSSLLGRQLVAEPDQPGPPAAMLMQELADHDGADVGVSVVRCGCLAPFHVEAARGRCGRR